MMLTELTRLISKRGSSPDDFGEARLAFLDTYACMLSGWEAPATQKIRNMLANAGAQGVGTIALTLGTAAHALDYDDYEDLGSTHPSAVIVSALTALLSHRAAPTRRVLSAYIAGYEAMLTVGQSLGHAHYVHGWHASATIGGVGAAMACAHLLELDRKQTETAISLAMSQAAGLKEQFGTECKPLHCGLAARAGAEAAQLAEIGFTSSPDAGEGFLRLYGNENSPGWASAMAAPPTIATNPPYKKQWPSCAYTHRIIEAAHRIQVRTDFQITEIASGQIIMPEPYLSVASFNDPKSADEARFSPSYCAASMLTDGHLNPSSFSHDALNRPLLGELCRKITLTPVPLADGLGDVSPEAPDSLILSFQDGTSLKETVRHLSGGPDKKLTSEQVCQKFTQCGGTEIQAENLLRTSHDAPFTVCLDPEMVGQTNVPH